MSIGPSPPDGTLLPVLPAGAPGDGRQGARDDSRRRVVAKRPPGRPGGARGVPAPVPPPDEAPGSRLETARRDTPQLPADPSETGARLDIRL